ncbi:complement C1s-B subcomponent [Ahrensia sp. R2A130]|nr:complement C1s-B subcomponent [Ahrensia sp. R2A130]
MFGPNYRPGPAAFHKLNRPGRLHSFSGWRSSRRLHFLKISSGKIPQTRTEDYG